MPPLATAEQIAELLQVTPRTVHYWATAGKIPTALRQGKIVRFSLADVAEALGIAGRVLQAADSLGAPSQHQAK